MSEKLSLNEFNDNNNNSWLLCAFASLLVFYPLASVLLGAFAPLFKEYNISNIWLILLSAFLSHIFLIFGVLISYFFINNGRSFKKDFFLRRWSNFYLVEAIIIEVSLFIPLALVALFSEVLLIFIKNLLPTYFARFIDVTPYFKQYLMNLSWESFILVGIIAIFVAPITEEIIFRRVIFGFFAKHLSLPLSLFLTAFIFAGIHFRVLDFLPLFLLGVVWQMVFIYYKSIYPSIIFHAFHNTLAMIILFFIKFLELQMETF